MWRDKQRNGLAWRCAARKSVANARSHLLHREERNERNRAWYEGLSGVEYNWQLLRHRRNQALARKQLRELRRETEGA